MAVEKVTFTLPEELLRRLEKIPAGKRSMVVREADDVQWTGSQRPSPIPIDTD